jgi:hypothetical protein
MPTPDAAHLARRLAIWLWLAGTSCALALPPPPPATPFAVSLSNPLADPPGASSPTNPREPFAVSLSNPLPEPTGATANPAPRIGLVTMQPGEEYWSRYGHNAILVDDGVAPTLYNYGYFDFGQPGFLTRFLRGRMLYRLMALPMERDLAGYAAEGRGAQLQWLALEPARAQELASFLAWNARPENADYRYDYFTDNCSTKVRDALDRAFGGALKRELSGRSHGYTYRDEARRLAATLPWLYFGTHLGLGPFTDRPLSLWEESFVPMRLAEALDETRIDGRPVVQARRALLPHRLGEPPAAPPDWRIGFLLTGLATACLLLLGTRPTGARGLRLGTATVIGSMWLACGLGGLGLLALWSFTDHVAAWGNENALLFNPLCLLLLAAVPSLARGTAPPRLASAAAMLVLGFAGLALFLKFLPFRIQSNGDWIALLLPIHAALAWRLTRAPAAR